MNRQEYNEYRKTEEFREKARLKSKAFWKNNPEKKSQHSINIKKALSQPNTREKVLNHCRTVFNNPVSKKKMIDSQSGENSVWFGRKHTEKTLTLMRKNNKHTLNSMRASGKLISPKQDTSIEVKIQNQLRELGYDFFTHQYMSEITHAYQCDIFIPSLNLVIECDGNYWHNYPARNDIDNIRTEELLAKGFKVLRLWEIEIKQMSTGDLKIKLEDFKR